MFDQKTYTFRYLEMSSSDSNHSLKFTVLVVVAFRKKKIKLTELENANTTKVNATRVRCVHKYIEHFPNKSTKTSMWVGQV